jgi:hypothetical protein
MSVLLTVSYRVSEDLEAFRATAAEVAAKIAGAPGVRWKIWGLSPDGSAVSAYLFETAEAADAFANGPIIAGLKANPGVQGVTMASATVDPMLSQVTRASFAT